MIHQLFPTQVCQKQLKPAAAPLNKALLKECYKFSEIDDKGQQWSQKNYPNGYTSYGSIANLHQISPYFEELAKLLSKQAQAFANTLQMDLKPGRLNLSSLWLNIMGEGALHTMHIHPLSVISGTYYLKVPPKASCLKVEDPRLAHHMASPPRKEKASRANQRFIEFQPKAGEVILFESWLKHEVPINQSKQNRVSVSFNFDWGS